MEKISMFDLYDPDAFDDVDDLLGLIFPSPPDPLARQPGQAADMLGHFVEACIANMGWAAADLARALQAEPSFVNALLNGSLPEDTLTDDLLVRLAAVIGYEPNILRILLRRDFLPTLEDDESNQPPAEQPHPAYTLYGDSYDEETQAAISELKQELEAWLDHLTQTLLHTVDVRHGREVSSDPYKARRYDSVLRQLEMILAKHRTDMRLVDVLLDELKTDYRISTPGEKDLHRRHIERLIHHIRDHAT